MRVSSPGRRACTATAASGAAVAVACSGSEETPPRSFKPDVYDRSCAVDADCTLAAPITDCRSCCVDERAVRKTPAFESAHDQVLEACVRRGSSCAAFCGEIAACVAGTCERRSR